MDRAAKLTALRNIGMTIGDASVIPVLSFLAGRLDTIHFVPEVDDARVWVHFSINTRLWPRVPFRAQVDQTPVNHPIALIEWLALRDDPIHIRTDVAGDPPEWLAAVLEEEALSPREALEASIQGIREKIDLALDAYRAANEAFPEADEEERRYLSYVLGQAKEEMKALNAQLNELERQVGASE